MKKDFNYFVKKSVNWKKENKEFDCDITLKEDDKEFKAYTVSVSNRDLLFYADNGCLNYVIDLYDNKAIASLYSINND